jgi:hypothetical protein
VGADSRPGICHKNTVGLGVTCGQGGYKFIKIIYFYCYDRITSNIQACNSDAIDTLTTAKDNNACMGVCDNASSSNDMPFIRITIFERNVKVYCRSYALQSCTTDSTHLYLTILLAAIFNTSVGTGRFTVVSGHAIVENPFK